MQTEWKTGFDNKNVFQKSSGKPAVTFLLVLIYGIVFCAFFDTHAQMPVLAPYTLTFGATPFVLGLVIGSYSLFNIFGNFAGGAMIDRKSWHSPLIYGLLGVSLALLFYTRAASAYHLVIIRAGHGFMGGLLVPAALASLTIKGKGDSFHDFRLALFGATIGLAAVTGPLFAGLTANRLGFHAVYYILALLMAFAFVIASTVIKKQPAAPGEFITASTSFRWILTRANLQGAFIFALGTMGSTGTLASFLPERAREVGFDHAQTGMLFAAFALTAIIIQMSWPRFLKPVLKRNLTGCAAGLLLLCTALVLAALAQHKAVLYAALVIYGAGFGFAFQGMLGMVMENSSPAWRGRAIGIFFAAYSLGVALVPPLSGLLWQYLPAAFPFHTSAVIALLSLVGGKTICARGEN